MSELTEVWIRRDQFTHDGLWRFLPPISVDSVEEIPADWPGMMEVPVSFVDSYDPEQYLVYGITRCAKPGDRRVLVRNLRPDMPEQIDITKPFTLAGCLVEGDFELVETLPRVEGITPQYFEREGFELYGTDGFGG